jgi:hypothetical protein
VSRKSRQNSSRARFSGNPSLKASKFDDINSKEYQNESSVEDSERIIKGKQKFSRRNSVSKHKVEEPVGIDPVISSHLFDSLEN